MATVYPVKTLPPGGADEPADKSRAFERLYRLPAPLCCVTKGSSHTTVAEGEIMIRKNISYCGLSVKMGAGYDVARIPLDHVSKWTLHQKRLLCLAPVNDIAVLVKPTGHIEAADIGAKDDEDFLNHVARHAPPAQGMPPTALAREVDSFTFATRCGANTRTMRLMSNGTVTFDEKQTGVTSFRFVDSAFLADLCYVRHTTAGLLNKIFMGGANRIEISFLGDKYFLDTGLPEDQLAKAHAAILSATLGGRIPSDPLKTYTGKIGIMQVGPEFTTVSVAKMASIPLLSSTEVTTIKTSDISHLRAALPSWQNALIKAIRDIELFKLSRAISALMGEDLVMLPVWPCTFFNDLYLSIILAMNALISIFQFIMIFLFRKTAVILGGPGPAKEVSFLPDENPEALLRGIAANVTVAQKIYSWGEAALAAKHVGLATGVGKDQRDPGVIVSTTIVSSV
jgi:hypothetical protein